MAKDYRISIQKLAALLGIAVILFLFIIYAKPILAPLLLAILLALILKPFASYFEVILNSRILSIIASFLIIFIPISLIGVLIYFQISSMAAEFLTLDEKIYEMAREFHLYLAERGLVDYANEELIRERVKTLTSYPLEMLGISFESIAIIVTGIMLTLIFTFFFLYYRHAFKNFLLLQMSKEKRTRAFALMERLEHISQGYLYGMGIVMLILAMLNSLGLWFIGVEYPFFWGFLAALLAIIPYIGTFIGGLLPFLYTLITSDTFWQPVAVVLLYTAVQFLEGNIITPKVIGDSVKLNPFTALLGLIMGGLVWGIVGMIIALPVMAMIKVLFESFTYTRPLALLMDNDIYRRGKHLVDLYDDNKYRLSSIIEVVQKEEEEKEDIHIN